MPDLRLFIDLILALVVVEFIALAAWRFRTGRGPSLAALAPNLAAGACLLMVARSALNDQGAQALGWLAAAGLAHVADLAQRFRQ